ncbi:MAG: type II toxin-antitoxin system RelE/ParE family toxin [Thermomonas sp.]|uniref:type II toxin-antitoxin system RelE/ParE family toxin n=1 Tax=Thermomonas sp. TaxID=1971895 RepID=UPI0039E283BE
MRRIFRTRQFTRKMRKVGLSDAALLDAVDEMAQGLIDADLGGGLVKKRVALPGRGKSGSTRTIVATNKGNRWFFLYGFEKNEKVNISNDELEALKTYATDLLKRTTTQLDDAVADGALQEITHDRQDQA